jgi:hypothetical protein
MKKLLILLVALLLLAAGFPLGMAGMGDCPFCTSPNAALTLCLGILCALVLMLAPMGSSFVLATIRPNGQLLTRSIYRPPRSL